MAENDKNPGGTITPSSLIIAASIVGAAAFIRKDASLDIPRPAVSESVYSGYSDRSVAARLWEDPFGAVALVENGGAENGRSSEHVHEEAAAHGLKITHGDRFIDDLSQGRFRVLVVSVTGAPYAEDAESRRRTRYAVLAGLVVKGYTPFDRQHIDYFSIGGKSKEKITSSSSAVTEKTLRAPSDTPLKIPFEWFEPPRPKTLLTLDGQQAVNGPRLLVLWVDEDYLNSQGSFEAGGASPLRKIESIIGVLVERGKYQPDDIAVLGPESSETRLILEKELKTFETKIRFYSYGATAEIPDNPKSVATLPNDLKLAERLREELHARGIDPLGHKVDRIAFISEWDTYYGRNIIDAMQKAFGLDSCEGVNSKCFQKTYLRGLNGAVAGGLKKSQNSEAKPKDIPKFLNAKNQKEADDVPIDRPDGQGQFDYLRRLAKNLRQTDEELKQLNPDDGIKAIGVLGSDVFDKLVILRALKPEFPAAVFFTTDYDAALQMEDQAPFTRNLIVSSGYGPALRRELQQHIPPFRSSYQTSAFYATQLAIEKKLFTACSVQDAVIFEIDRHGHLIQLGPRRDDELRPPPPAMYPNFNKERLLFSAKTALIFGFSLLFLVSVIHWRKHLSKIDSVKVRHVWSENDVSGDAILIGVISLLFAAVCISWPNLAPLMVAKGEGEPLLFTVGLSAWPTILCRVAATILTIRLLFRTRFSLYNNMLNIIGNLAVAGPGTTMNFVIEAESGLTRGLLSTTRSYFSYILAFFDKNSNNFARDRLDQALKKYILFESWRFKAIRVAVFSLVATLAFLAVLEAYGSGEPSIRGVNLHMLEVYHWSLYFEVFFVSALCIYIIDSVILCLAFIQDIAKDKTSWPDSCREAMIKELGFAKPLLGVYEPNEHLFQTIIDLVFIEARTKCVLPLVYSPFFVIALTIVARSNAFDAFPPCWVAIAGDVLAVSVVFLCAYFMNRQAAIVRANALERLDNAIVRAQRDKDSKDEKPKGISGVPEGMKAGVPESARDFASLKQLEKLKEWTHGLDEGAFSPPLQQPLLRGLIMPFVGVAFNLMADYGWLPML